MNDLTIEQQIQKLRDLVYDVRVALCWPPQEGETITSSMVNEFIKTDVLTAYEKTQQLNNVWKATGEMLDIMDGRWKGWPPPEIHYPKACQQRLATWKPETSTH